MTFIFSVRVLRGENTREREKQTKERDEKFLDARLAHDERPSQWKNRSRAAAMETCDYEKKHDRRFIIIRGPNGDNYTRA